MLNHTPKHNTPVFRRIMSSGCIVQVFEMKNLNGPLEQRSPRDMVLAGRGASICWFSPIDASKIHEICFFQLVLANFNKKMILRDAVYPHTARQSFESTTSIWQLDSYILVIRQMNY